MELPDNVKINLNQNLWGLLVSFAFLGTAEHLKLYVLFWFSIIPALVMVVSICVTTWAYTQRYVTNKSARSS